MVLELYMRKYFFIFFNTVVLIFSLEIILKVVDFFDEDYFDKKKQIISFYSNYKSHPVIGYTARKNTAGYEIHYTTNDYFKTTTNSDGFRTHEFFPKHKDNFRVLILGDSFMYGMNAHDDETTAKKLELLYKKKISNKIEVLSMGIVGYSGLNYAGIARTYFDYLKPDLIIVCVDQSDLNDDEAKDKLYDYEVDENNFPYFIKFNDNEKNKDLIVKSNRDIIFKKNNNRNFINKVKFESSLYTRINSLKHKLRRYNLDKTFKKLTDQKNNTIIYNNLTDLEQENLYKIVNSGDILRYDLERSKVEYKVTLNSLKYVVKKAKDINAKVYMSTYPYSWFINKEFSKYYQLKNFDNLLDFRSNKVYPDLINYYASLLQVQNLDSYSFFSDTNKKYWGDFDPHFNADGYAHYANFLFENTKDFINENILDNQN
jgi:hypothetical protein